MASKERSRVNLCCFRRGQGIHPYLHEGDLFLLALKGAGDYLDGEERYPVTGGDVQFVPAGVPHGVKNTGSRGGGCQHFSLGVCPWVSDRLPDITKSIPAPRQSSRPYFRPPYP